MLEAGVIEPSRSPCSSPVVLVKKQDGSICFCIDHRKLYEVTVKDVYPLPRIDDVLASLAGKHVIYPGKLIDIFHGHLIKLSIVDTEAYGPILFLHKNDE
jgi:hypothetical protein